MYLSPLAESTAEIPSVPSINHVRTPGSIRPIAIIIVDVTCVTRMKRSRRPGAAYPTRRTIQLSMRTAIIL